MNQKILQFVSLFFQICKTKHLFENVAFKRSTNLTIKLKISLISDLSDKAGFTCFDWFRFGLHNGLMVKREHVFTCDSLNG